MDRGAWQATVHGVTKSQTRLSNYTAAAAAGTIKPCIPHEGAEAQKDGAQFVSDRRRPCNKAVRFQTHAPNMPDEARYCLDHGLFCNFSSLSVCYSR